jgi:hypothetical protein
VYEIAPDGGIDMTESGIDTKKNVELALSKLEDTPNVTIHYQSVR